MADNVSPRELLTVEQGIGTNWMELGLKLHVPYEKLENLRGSSQPTMYGLKLFDRWYKKDPLPCQQLKTTLADALTESDRRDLAEKVLAWGIAGDNDLRLMFQDISKCLIRDWETVGIYLEMTTDEMDLIKAPEPQAENPPKRMLQIWKQTSGGTSRTALATALRDIGRVDLANALYPGCQQPVLTQQPAPPAARIIGTGNQSMHQCHSLDNGDQHQRQHQQASFGQPTETQRQHQQASFGQPTETQRQHQQASFGQPTETQRQHQQASFGQPTETQRQHQQASFGQPTETQRQHQQASFGQPTETQRQHQQASFRQPTETQRQHQPQACVNQPTEIQQADLPPNTPPTDMTGAEERSMQQYHSVESNSGGAQAILTEVQIESLQIHDDRPRF